MCLAHHWIGKEPPLLFYFIDSVLRWLLGAVISAILRVLIPPYARRDTYEISSRRRLPLQSFTIDKAKKVYLTLLPNSPNLARTFRPCRVHGVHCLVTVLALAESQVLYSRLRDAYNAGRVPGAPPIPPLKEWQGVGVFCRHIFCRCGLV